MTPEIGLLLSFGFFIVLVAIGLAVPFSILLPSLLYLFLLGGWSSFNALGIVS